MSAAQPRVIHVTAPAQMGGLESVVLQLASAMRLRGQDVRVAAVLTPGTCTGHPFITALESADVPVHAFELGTRAYHAEWNAVRKLTMSVQANVLHTHGYRADIVHGSLARTMGIPHVMTLHGFVRGGWRDRLYERLQVWAARRASAVVAVSQPIVDRLESARVTKGVHLLRNAMAPLSGGLNRDEARRALGIPAEVPAIGWIGRVSHEKGPDQFIAALAKSLPSIVGVLLGDGPQREAVIALAAALGVSARLIAPGAVPDARRYLAAFDAVALTSRTEGTPMVLLEAMSAGVPMVTTMVGGVPDVVSDEEALCCQAGDVTGLAQAFSQVIADPGSAAKRAMRAQAAVEQNFGIEPWLDGYERIYSAVAASEH